MKKYLLIFLFLSPCFSFTQNSKIENIHHLFKYIEKQNGFSGSVLVSEDEHIIYKEAFGYANPELKIKNHAQTAFDVASTTKLFTALGILILADDGRLSLDDTLDQLFENFPNFGIQIQHLLSHTSGLPDYSHNHSFDLYLKNKIADDSLYSVSNSDLINWYSEENVKLRSIPGEKYAYCNAGYILLASIIENKSSMGFYDFLRTKILEPSQMHDSKFYDQLSQYDKENRAIGFERSLDGRTIKPVRSFHEKYPGEGLKGDGGLYTTTGDLYKFLQAIFNNKLLSKQLLKEALTPFKMGTEKKSPFGYGWIIRSEGYENRPLTYKHGGRWEGFLIAFAYEPATENSIIILTNNSLYPPTIGETEKAISHILAEKEYKLPRFPIRDTIAHTIYLRGVEEGVKTYKRLKKNSPDRFFFDEHQLNLLGYLLLWDGKKEEAVRVLELNAEEYPDLWNSYDSLGDIYKEVGDIENAKKAYKKAIELNPERKKTISKLDELTRDKSAK